MATALVVAVRKHLMIENEGASETIKQMRGLTPEDRADLVRYFNAEGYDVTDDKATK